MKKILAVLFILFCSTKLFADFAIGANIYAGFSDFSNLSPHNVTDWGFGGNIGLGEMKGRPFILEVVGNSYGPNNAQVRANLDWHLLPINLFGLLQVYLGLGVGSIFNFNPNTVWDDIDWEDLFSANTNSLNSMNLILTGRIPFGVKLFLKKFELFVSMTPQLGWNFQNKAFYWSVDLGTGFRLWF